jgi:8-oxo-(d)GTP phosphatase
VTQPPILAAGGLVIRQDGDGTVKVLMVHRPRYDDWSLPKGKTDHGETPAETALREVEEETGIRCRIIAPVAEAHYRVPTGEDKVVRYFAMRPLQEPPFVPNPEVSEIRWLAPADAAQLATYAHDRTLLENDVDRMASMGTVFLVRHGAAGDRSVWVDDDRLRPLTPKGVRQAAALATMLAPRGVDAIYSSPYVRCLQTVEPLAAVTGLELNESEMLAEGGSTAAALDWLLSMVGANIVACSHGDVIPSIVQGLERRGVPLRTPHGAFDVKKGSVWALEVERGGVVSASYEPPPLV